MQLSKILNKQSDYTVLAFFAISPMRAFSVHEIRKTLRLSAKTFHFSVNKLISFGIVKKFSKLSVDFYMLKHLPIDLSPVRTAYADSYQKTDIVAKVLASLKGLDNAILSGVFSAQPSKNVDIIFIGDLDKQKVEAAIKNLEMALDIDLVYASFTPNEFELRQAALDIFIRNVMDDPHLIYKNKIFTKHGK